MLKSATLTAFLAWFGGTGYLLTRFSTVWVGLGLFLSVVSGLIGGGIVFLFLSRVLMSNEAYMDPADYEMVGVLGRICMPIREGGTGELIYSQVGTRRVCGVRSDNGGAHFFQRLERGRPVLQYLEDRDAIFAQLHGTAHAALREHSVSEHGLVQLGVGTQRQATGATQEEVSRAT